MTEGLQNPQTVRVIALLALALACSVVAEPAHAQQTKSDSMTVAFRRAQRLVNDGAGPEGRAIVDSVLEQTEPGSAEEAEALFWRATLGESWDTAQRDYLRLMLEHERSPRAADAMLRLAQGELARGDREAAERYLERLAREAPSSAARGEAGLWHGRLLLERGRRTEGCALLRETRQLVASGALELVNQYEYQLRDCPAVASVGAAAVAPPRTDSLSPPPRATPVPMPAPTRTPPAAETAGGWSVQAAALETAAEAHALAQRLRDRGYDARVDGTTALFRVRFGRYATRAAAAAAMDAYKTKERAVAFLVEVPRG